MAKARFQLRKLTVAVAVIAVGTLGLTGFTPPVAPAEKASTVSVNRGPKVPGHHAAPISAHPSPASNRSAAPATGQLPAPGDFQTNTPLAGTLTPLTTYGGSGLKRGQWQNLGDTGIAVAATTPSQTAAPRTKGTIDNPVASVKATILDPAEAKKFGLKGLVIKLSRTDAATTAAPVAVRIPNKLLNSLYGADYASRLKWVQVDGANPAATATAAASATSTKTASPASAQPVPMTMDMASSAVVATPMLSAEPMLLAATAGPISSTGTGSFTATPLKPSSTWDVSAQTGDFSWSYPFRVPPAAGGPAPSVSVNYDSQSIDGETGSTNNQASAIGDGWSLAGAGFIERSYVSCASDTVPVTTSGDLCWKTDNATISFAGHSGQLVKDTTSGTWKLQNDDGTKFERFPAAAGCGTGGAFDGDYWKMTTRDGTQYFFGKNQLPGWVSGKPTTNSTWTVPVFGNDAGEPCHASTFAASSGLQAWRWNLDFVLDTHGNAESFYYNAQTNIYSKNKTTATAYTRGGELEHIDYGFTSTTTSGNAYATNAASGKVVFGYDPYGRCSDATHANCTSEPASGYATTPAHPTYYPDVPFDQNCITGTCTAFVSPTFWTTSMLSTVTTKALVAGAYSNVDVWTLGHSFPPTGETANPALWMTQISHTGYAGTASLTEPTTTFTGATMTNRVLTTGSGLSPLARYRITTLQTSLGAVISINYSAAQCGAADVAPINAAPATNTKRCFPQLWTPQVTPPQAPQTDLFHKYVVNSVVSNPGTGNGMDQTQETDYVYTGLPAWRYNNSPLIPDNARTWNVFAGYNTIEIRVGAPGAPTLQQTTDYTFYQGLDGDRAGISGGTKSVSVTGSPGVPDSLWFAGRTREAKTVNGVGGATLSDTVTTPWASAVTANNGVITARLTGDGDVLTTEPVSTGGNRTVHTVNTLDPATGLPTQVSVAPSDTPHTCTTTSYLSNSAVGIIGAPYEIKKVGVDCTLLASASYPADLISDTRTAYDTAAFGIAPTKGDPTETDTVDAYVSGAPTWAKMARTTYDSMGRPLVATDVLGHTTTTAYTPAAGAAAGSGATTSTTVTNTAPFGWPVTTVIDPRWGVETKVTDQNGKATTATYDALGRRTAVWLTDHTKASFPTAPSIGYAYTLSKTVPNTVATTTLAPTNTMTSYQLFDGLGLPIQTQAPSAANGTIVTDTMRDSAGRVRLTNSAYWTTAAAPSATLFVPSSESAIPDETTTSYDGAGRPTATTVFSLGVQRSQTTVAYTGADRVDTTPPGGGTPTTQISNSLGQQTQLTQYLNSTPTGSATETTSYSYTVQGKMAGMVDPAGNHWGWSFDVLGHQTSAVDPDTGTTTSSNDDAGNLLTSTDARGVTLAYTYDALNRKTSEHTGTTTGPILAAWTYDTAAKGQPDASTSYVGSTSTTPGAAYSSTVTGYDAGYRPTGVTVSIPAGAPAFAGTSYTTGLQYYQNGALGEASYPAEGGLAAEDVLTAYNSEGHASGLSSADTIVGGVFYTGINQIAQIHRTGTAGLDSNYQYDPATGAPTDIKDATTIGTTTVTQADRVYSHNPVGDVTAIKTTGAAGADSQCFSYDYLHDLTQAWTPNSNDCTAAPTATTIGGAAPYWTNYTNDPATGNRTKVTNNPTTGSGTPTTDSYAYPTAGTANPHAVQSVTHTAGTGSTDTYGYDQIGNTTTRPGQTLTYDATGKLATVTTSGVTQSNIYDANGTLLMQTDPTNGTTLFLGDTELQVAAGSSTPSAVRTYSVNGIPVAERSSTAGVSGSQLCFLGVDANHTADLEIDARSGVLSRRFIDPYGVPRGATSLPWSSTHGYLNAPTSSQSDLTHLGSRAYDPVTGRFLSVDPVLAPFNPQQNNGYRYAGDNPITMSDPSGNCTQGATDSLDFNSNCAGGYGTNAPGAGPAYQAPIPISDSGHGGKPPKSDEPKDSPYVDGCESPNVASCLRPPKTVQPIQVCVGMNLSSACRPALPGEGGPGHVTCISAQASSIVVGASGSICNFQLGNFDSTNTAGGDFTLGPTTKLGASIGVGFGYTNATSRADIDSLTWLATGDYATGLGVGGTYSWGFNAKGDYIWMALVSGEVGVGGGLSAGGGTSCRLGETC
ncbi:RHS repeat domain-containing protein [Diaminobutyricibacter sp. McL0608]|uniref:RHS repeat domain-containing protein n=1 Tax=Leifsonia sp. McL0608 TaxID=3143537 RepID=UPI0031F3146D